LVCRHPLAAVNDLRFCSSASTASLEYHHITARYWYFLDSMKESFDEDAPRQRGYIHLIGGVKRNRKLASALENRVACDYQSTERKFMKGLRKRIERLEKVSEGDFQTKVEAFLALRLGVPAERILVIVKGGERQLGPNISRVGMVTWEAFCQLRDLGVLARSCAN
jgi:hypothetical protein